MDNRALIGGLVVVALIAGLFAGPQLFPRLITETQTLVTTTTTPITATETKWKTITELETLLSTETLKETISFTEKQTKTLTFTETTVQTVTETILSTTIVEPKPSKSIIKVIEHRSFRDSFGWLHIAGLVKNEGKKRVKFVQVVVIVYDSKGYVIGGDVGYTTPSELGPGDKGAFDIDFYDDYINVHASGYRIFVFWPRYED